MEKTFNLSEILQHLISAVPVWGLIFWAIQHWLKKNEVNAEKLISRLDTLEEGMEGIRLSLAVARLPEIKQKMEEIEDRQISIRSKVETLWMLKEAPQKFKKPVYET